MPPSAFPNVRDFPPNPFASVPKRFDFSLKLYRLAEHNFSMKPWSSIPKNFRFPAEVKNIVAQETILVQSKEYPFSNALYRRSGFSCFASKELLSHGHHVLFQEALASPRKVFLLVHAVILSWGHKFKVPDVSDFPPCIVFVSQVIDMAAIWLQKKWFALYSLKFSMEY